MVIIIIGNWKVHRRIIWLTSYCILYPPDPITTPGVPTGMNLFTCKCHTIFTVPSLPPAASTHSGRATWCSLGLLDALLLLELPELGLDGDRGLLSFRVFHVNVKVLRDVRLGRIWEKKEKMHVNHSSGPWVVRDIFPSQVNCHLLKLPNLSLETSSFWAVTRTVERLIGGLMRFNPFKSIIKFQFAI